MTFLGEHDVAVLFEHGLVRTIQIDHDTLKQELDEFNFMTGTAQSGLMDKGHSIELLSGMAPRFSIT
jgi:hypothetical protein